MTHSTLEELCDAVRHFVAPATSCPRGTVSADKHVMRVYIAVLQNMHLVRWHKCFQRNFIFYFCNICVFFYESVSIRCFHNLFIILICTFSRLMEMCLWYDSNIWTLFDQMGKSPEGIFKNTCINPAISSPNGSCDKGPLLLTMPFYSSIIFGCFYRQWTSS